MTKSFQINDADISDEPLSMIVDSEMDYKTPLLFCSTQGYDASFLVDAFAFKSNALMTSVGLGAAESLSQAESSIVSCAKVGNWVLLKNLHLVTHWIPTLEKKLSSLQPNKSFRLFITTEMNEKIPATLIRSSKVHSLK